MPLPRGKRYTKFMLESKDSFEIEVKVSSGAALVSITDDPEFIDVAPTWQLQQTIGTGYIKVRTDDPNFHLGTMYFVSLENVSTLFIPTTVSLKVNQVRTVYKIPNNVPTKFQFTSDRELVKFLVFQIPNSWSSRTNTQFEIEALSDHVYPSMYLKKLEYENEPEDVETMDYPSVFDWQEAYGTNPTVMLNQKKLTYQSETTSQGNYNYYVMAIYQNTYGMTDRRKPEFKLTINSVQVPSPLV